MTKRLDEMTDEELSREEFSMLDKISIANREAKAGLSRIHDIHRERLESGIARMAQIEPSLQPVI